VLVAFLRVAPEAPWPDELSSPTESEICSLRLGCRKADLTLESDQNPKENLPGLNALAGALDLIFLFWRAVFRATLCSLTFGLQKLLVDLLPHV
jgi:hypothetical protein